MNPRREVFQGGLVIHDDVIKTVYEGGPEQAPKADTVIDAQGALLIPGLIQPHVHLCQSLFRGQADDLELLDWLRRRIWPLEGAHDADSLYYSALLGIGELFRGGTTSIVDMETVHHTESAFEAIGDAGIRAVSGKCMMDWGEGVPPTLKETAEDSLRESVDLLEKWDGRFNGRLRYALTPRFAVSCSDRLMREVASLSHQYGVPVHTHASENRDEIRIVEAERGMRNVEYFEHLGLTGPGLILAHCIWLSDREREILARSGTNAVHCPSSNLKLASGLAPVPELLDAGVNVCIAADGAPCGNNLDMFMEMRLTALIHKPGRGPRVMPAQTVFEMATLHGAKAMGQADHIGSLEPGKKADLALVSVRNLHSVPQCGAQNVYATLVYEAQSSDVTLTMVDGSVVYRDGRLTTIDEEDVRARCESILRAKREAVF